MLRPGMKVRIFFSSKEQVVETVPGAIFEIVSIRGRTKNNAYISVREVGSDPSLPTINMLTKGKNWRRLFLSPRKANHG